MTSSTDRPRIVVGVDGSPQSEQALRWAVRLAASEKAVVEVVAAWEYPIVYGWAPLPSDYDPEKEITRLTDDTIESVFPDGRPEGMFVTVASGSPSRAIIDRGNDARLIVVGSRGRGGFTGLLLGSVSKTVIEHATVPVFVVRGDVPAD